MNIETGQDVGKVYLRCFLSNDDCCHGEKNLATDHCRADVARLFWNSPSWVWRVVLHWHGSEEKGGCSQDSWVWFVVELWPFFPLGYGLSTIVDGRFWMRDSFLGLHMEKQKSKNAVKFSNVSPILLHSWNTCIKGLIYRDYIRNQRGEVVLYQLRVWATIRGGSFMKCEYNN